MKRKIAAIIVALAAVFGGIASAAPAQAVWGSDVHYYAQGAGVPSGTLLSVTRMDGPHYDLSKGDFMYNAWRVCPYIGYHLRVQRGDVVRVLGNNDCHFPQQATPSDHYDYTVRVN